MLIAFNWIGGLFVFGSFIVTWILSNIMPSISDVGVSGLLMLGLDISYRWKIILIKFDEQPYFKINNGPRNISFSRNVILKSNNGGLFGVPVWIIGILLIFAAFFVQNRNTRDYNDVSYFISRIQDVG